MGMIPTRMNPLGWKPKKETGPYWGLIFTAEQANSTVQLTKVGSPADVYLDVSYDDGITWSAYTIGDTITLAAGQQICFAARTGTTNNSFGISDYDYYKFVLSGIISARGDISSIRLKNKHLAKTLTMPDHCYFFMFNGCTALTTAPELPATTLAQQCYQRMFNGCTALTTAPALPATTLKPYCYENMFRGCTSLTTAPTLPAKTLAGSSYSNMFNGCTNLNWVEVGLTSWKGTSSANWLSGVSSTGTFRCPAALGNNSTIGRGTSKCPYVWTVVNI